MLTTSFMLQKQLLLQLKRRAETDHRSASAIMRMALIEFLGEKK